ncbi:hypothetical protein CJF42_22815 [Pseudoalteromonas sp. NBT06-2]|uniref:hypothetical protein n=1 Tax=Pseudoalteromonas sp. NBT06-2 TaxID=2025950 RepID=UPI000BA7ABF3|nr:hypothetical protein [Pseudoalteromonas sp. NBT06-2]PAJ72141.1 hypothetical protein CJF42_22815 [Pseudoalteromonas sp. NBT06-2]
MLKPLSKLMLMITILVAFLGQTMSYHFMASYDGTSEFHTKIQQQTFVYDNDSSNTSESIDDCCEVECCEIECICPANACASIAYLDNNIPISELLILSEPQLSLTTKGTHFIAKSLYRPPIFAS